MTFVNRTFLHPITYWSPGKRDSAGGVEYLGPILIWGHYEESNIRVDAYGIEVESDASACVDTDVLVGGLLLLGDYTVDSVEASVVEDARRRARRIVRFDKTPSVRKGSALQYDRTAYM